MFLRNIFLISLGVSCCLLSGCSEAYLPRFDGGILNPDIRFLRAAEIVEGVKCATVAFMDERERLLLEDRKNPTKAKEYYRPIEGPTFQTYALNVPPGVPEKCNKPGMHWEPSADPTTPCAPNWCERETPDLGVTLWDYELSGQAAALKEQVQRASGAPRKLAASEPFTVEGYKPAHALPQLETSSLPMRFTPREQKRVTRGSGCRAIPDYSRFALDPTQTATITLTLLANNFGQVNYTKIDAGRLDPHQLVIAPGGGANGAPFPQLFLNGKGTTTFDMAIQLPQTVHGYVFSPSKTAIAGTPFIRPVNFEDVRQSLKRDTTRGRSRVQPAMAPDGGREMDKNSEDYLEDARELLRKVDSDAIAPESKIAKDQIRELRSFANEDKNSFSNKTPEQKTLIDDAVNNIRGAVRSLERINRELSDYKENTGHISAYKGILLQLSRDTTDPRLAASAEAVIGKLGAVNPPKLTEIVNSFANATYEDFISRFLPAKIIQKWADKEIDYETNEFEEVFARSVDGQEVLKIQLDISRRRLQLDLLFILSGTDDDNTTRQLFNKRVDRLEKDLSAIAFAQANPHMLPGFLRIPGKSEAENSDHEKRQKKLSPNQHFESCDIKHSRLQLDGSTQIDYLGLKNMLNKAVEQDEGIHVGTPEATLDSLTLTSAFQVVLDTSAGMSHLFKILPLLVPPTAELKKDHTHTLKISFKGLKQKKNPAKEKNIEISCKERFATFPDQDNICNTQLGQLLEQIIQNTQSSPSSGAASPQ